MTVPLEAEEQNPAEATGTDEKQPPVSNWTMPERQSACKQFSGQTQLRESWSLRDPFRAEIRGNPMRPRLKRGDGPGGAHLRDNTHRQKCGHPGFGEPVSLDAFLTLHTDTNLLRKDKSEGRVDEEASVGDIKLIGMIQVVDTVWTSVSHSFGA